MYIHTHRHIITINLKRAINLKESREKHMEGFRGRKVKREML